jgi:alcohol dehydrogenase (cytochrome c)
MSFSNWHVPAAAVRPVARIFFSLAALAILFGVTPCLHRNGLAAAPQQAANGDWTYVDHDFNGTRYSPLTQITPANVKQLAKVCSYTFPEKVPSESAPIVSAGVLYATSDHYTVAIDAADCHVLWSYQWIPRDTDRVHPHRGAALANGKIIRGTGDDYLISLDAESGKLLWAEQIADPKEGFFIAMPPLVTDDMIYIGPAGSERAGTGWMGAFRLSDGRPVWKFNIIPQGDEPGGNTWGPNPEARKHAGGALWTAQSYDSEKGILFVAGGNPAPDFYDDARPGSNLYTNSMIALDGKTGRLLWYNQFLPHDVDDYDITHVNPIFKVNSRTMIASSGKDGVLRVVDGETHKVVYSSPFTTQLNSEVPLTTSPLKVCPGILGGDEWNSGAFSPKLGLLVMPANDQWCSTNMKDKYPPSVEKANSGETSYFGGPIDHGAFAGARGRLTGFDAATGKERWRYQAPTPLVAGVAVTASDLIFTGETGGFFDAVDATSGKVLMHLDMGDSIQGGVITYSAHNTQYVAVTSGDGNVIGHKNFPEIKGGNPMVTVFGLPKK